MKKSTLLIAAIALSASSLFAWNSGRCSGNACSYGQSDFGEDLTAQIPEIAIEKQFGFQKVANVAQYKNADWSNVVGIVRSVSLQTACEIAQSDPSITYFFHMKGGQMVLETEGGYRLFRHGDAVFFAGEPWWGSAPGFSDGYVKESE